MILLITTIHSCMSDTNQRNLIDCIFQNLTVSFFENRILVLNMLKVKNASSVDSLKFQCIKLKHQSNHVHFLLKGVSFMFIDL